VNAGEEPRSPGGLDGKLFLAPSSHNRPDKSRSRHEKNRKILKMLAWKITRGIL